MAKAVWKRGRGKLGVLEPLIGRWTAEASTPMGPVRCTRTFAKVLGEKYVRLDARWEFGPAGRNLGVRAPEWGRREGPARRPKPIFRKSISFLDLNRFPRARPAGAVAAPAGPGGPENRAQLLNL